MAEIISVGTELLLGQITNTNSRWLSNMLSALGIDVFYHTSVGDNRERLKQVLQIALKRSDLIITTGGLGPTQDDLTKEVVSEVLGLKLIRNEEVIKNIKCFFERLNKGMAHNNEKQGYIPEGAKVIPNDIGTAPGVIVEKDDKTVIMFPGPPHEMHRMFKKHVSKYLQEKYSEGIIKSKVLNFIGIGESDLEVKVKKFLDNKNPTVAPLAKKGEVCLRITAKAKTVEEADKAIEKMEGGILKILGPYHYGYNNKPLEFVVGDYLITNNITIAVAESCTGGLVSDKLTNVPGISNVLMQGIVAYSNEAKMKLLKVPKELLEQYGAVSSQVAVAMASGIRKEANTDVGLGITGIAGPGGGSPQKPVGLVYVGFVSEDFKACKKLQLHGKRVDIKERAAKYALNFLRECVKQNK